MTRSSLIFYFIVWLSVMLSTPCGAQKLFTRKANPNRYSSFGLGLGTSHYYGDLSSPSPKTFYFALYTNVRWNLHAHYTRQINPSTAIRMQVSWVRLLGDDYTYANRNISRFFQSYIRNLNFRNDVKELTFSGIFNLIPSYENTGAKDRLKFTPYFTAGIGLISHNPKGFGPDTASRRGWTTISLRPKTTNANGSNANEFLPPYSTIAVVVPLGLGLRFKVNNKIDISLEGNLRLTSTRYIDDVGSNRYPNQSIYNSRPDFIYSYRAWDQEHVRSHEDRGPTLTTIFNNPSLVAGSPSVPDFLDQDLSTGTFYNPANDPTLLRSHYEHRDMYVTTQITISYIIGKTIKCPVPN